MEADQRPWWRQAPPWPMWFRVLMAVLLLGAMATLYGLGRTKGYQAGYAEASCDAVTAMRDSWEVTDPQLYAATTDIWVDACSG